MNQSSRSFQFDGAVEVKSKFDAEFRRFSLERSKCPNFEVFKVLLQDLHHLQKTPFLIKYADPRDNDLLPITNDDNYIAALKNAKPLLRLVIQREGEAYDDPMRHRHGGTFLSTIMGTPKQQKTTLTISNPKEFRQVSAIIDVDLVPETCRRKLHKYN